MGSIVHVDGAAPNLWLNSNKAKTTYSMYVDFLVNNGWWISSHGYPVFEFRTTRDHCLSSNIIMCTFCVFLCLGNDGRFPGFHTCIKWVFSDCFACHTGFSHAANDKPDFFCFCTPRKRRFNQPYCTVRGSYRHGEKDVCLSYLVLYTVHIKLSVNIFFDPIKKTGRFRVSMYASLSSSSIRLLHKLILELYNVVPMLYQLTSSNRHIVNRGSCIATGLWEKQVCSPSR